MHVNAPATHQTWAAGAFTSSGQEHLFHRDFAMARRKVMHPPDFFSFLRTGCAFFQLRSFCEAIVSPLGPGGLFFYETGSV